MVSDLLTLLRWLLYHSSKIVEIECDLQDDQQAIEMNSELLEVDQ